VCTRESGAVYEAGGLNCVLTFIKEHGSVTQSAGLVQGLKVYTDTLHSAMTVVSRLCGKMEPQDSSLPSCIESLSSLLKHDDPFVSKLFCVRYFQKHCLTSAIFYMNSFYNLLFIVSK